MAGWIKLHRNIRKHWLYEEKREFSKFEAWMDLLMAANYLDNEFLVGNDLFLCKRGELLTSKRKLSENWNWSITKVTNFLNLLEKSEMIKHESTTKNTTIFVVNYDSYQDIDLDKINEINLKNIENSENKSETKSNQNENKNDEKSNSEVTEESNTQETDYSKDIDSSLEVQVFPKVTEKEHTKRNQKENESKTKENQKETKKNIKNLKNKDINKYIYSESEKDIFENENLKEISKLYENNLGPIGSVIAKDLIEISELFKADMFEEAIAIAARGGTETLNMRYVKGILRKWQQAKVMTIEDLETVRNRENNEKEANVNKNNSHRAYNSSSRPLYKNRFHNFEQRTDSLSEDDMEAMARKKREEYFKKIDKKKEEDPDSVSACKILEFNKKQKIG